MKNMKKILAVTTIVSIIGATGIVAYAATAQSPAEIVSELTGKSVDELLLERQAGSTYGTIASDNGVLDEFKALSLEQKKVVLNERVAAGTLSQEDADEIYAQLVDAQTTCDGSGNLAIGQNYGIGFGSGNGLHDGTGMGSGRGDSRGTGGSNGQGMGRGRNR